MRTQSELIIFSDFFMDRGIICILTTWNQLGNQLFYVIAWIYIIQNHFNTTINSAAGIYHIHHIFNDADAV